MKSLLGDTLTKQLLDCITTMQEAGWYLIGQQADEKICSIVRSDLSSMISGVIGLLRKKLQNVYEDNEVVKICKSIQITIARLSVRKNDTAYQHSKIQYELIPLLEEAYQKIRYWFWAVQSDENMKQYKAEAASLCANYYIDEAEKRGEYKYEVAFTILAYNQLAYTKLCVQSLLKNIPEGLRYELILVNHGSDDGTMEYFESIHPAKQLDIGINGGGKEASIRICESKYCIGICNDVLITPHAIDNLLSCIKSDDKIALAVPSTSSVSNLQTIPISYTSLEQLEEFAEENNRTNPFRWEQRVRLCNPIEICRSATLYGSNGVLPNSYLGAATVAGFPDDMQSLLLRRHGYKMMLVKDAYCHHFGSITIGKEISQDKNDFYFEGRQKFQSIFGIDPWGTGFCHDIEFHDCVVKEGKEPLTILGINCGMGSNSLKIKEQLKEYNHNIKTNLVNITNKKEFFDDLQGVSDSVEIITSLTELAVFLEGKIFDYIVWDASFLVTGDFLKIVKKLRIHYSGKGYFFIKQNMQNQMYLKTIKKADKFKGNWWIIN